MDKAKDKPLAASPTLAAAKPKEKRRSNEKRKEKSRDAARCRRSRETEIFTELGQVLPLQREEVEQLDKASIMRLSIAFLKIRETLKLFPKIENLSLLPSEDEKIEELDKKPFDLLNGKEAYECMSLALDGFLILLSSDGDVTYVSENVAEYLGISQIDILGQQIWEYTHQCDHDELKEALNVRRNGSGKNGDDKKENALNGGDIALTTVHRDFFLRLKCTLTSRGRSVNIKSASFKVIHITGHMVMNNEGDRILIAVGRPLPHPSNIEIPLGTTTFLTKHSLDMKFTYVDDKMLSLLGYQPEDLLGKSLYDCHHGADSESLMTTFKSVLSKGQCETARYRFLGKCGGYSWVVTQATIVYDKQKPQSVVCVNYAISEIENNNEIYSCAQLEAYRQNQEIITAKDDHQQEILEKSDKQQQQQQQQIPSKQSHRISDDENSNDCLINNNIKINNENDQIKCDLIQVKRNCNSVGVIVEPIKQQQQQQQLNKKRDETPLSPIRRTFNNCSISSTPSPTITTPTTIIKSQEIRPKSVTASVFTQVPINSDYLQNLNHHQITTQQSITSSSSSLSTTGTILKAQSVTASVLTPISSLSTPINRSFLSANLTKFLPRNSSAATANTTAAAAAATEDMNKGYLMFAEESHDLTMLKEEPDDLTHLAPTAGDACIPLDESTPLFGEMLESLILPDAYGTLLSDDINSLDSQQSNCNNTSNNKNHHIDPFINYRDESSDTSHSPHLLSPGSASKSPEMSSLPSLCSPNSLSQDDEFAFMTMNVEDDIDLTMRAPYIPMNEQEDLPLLTEDLMWSAFSDELSLHKDIKEALQMEAMKNQHNTALNNNSLNSSNSNTINTTTNVTNEHHGNNNHNNSSESSLAALLCGNSIQQDDNSTILNDSSDSKKRKILRMNDNTANSLVDNIDAFGPVFSKNSTNVDCWTMSDLLQINTATNNTSTLHQENRPEKQNIIVNTAIPATIHVPLIAIQNKNNCNAKLSCSSILNNNNKNNNISTNMTTTTATINTTTTQNHNNSFGNNNSNNNNNTSTMKKLSAKTIHVAPIISNKSNSLANSKISNNFNLGAIITTSSSSSSSSSSSCSSKRPSNIIVTSETKRVKTLPMVEIPTSPQLLQQLMAPTPQRQRTKSPYDKIQTGRWIGDNGDGQQTTNLSPSSQSPSNSVLKNLLVSGCDDTFPPQPPDIILDEVQLQRSLQASPNQQSFYIAPLTCTTSTTTEQIMRHCGTNPMIGGVGILPSPPIAIDAEDEAGECVRSLNPVAVASFSPSGSDSGVTSDSDIESGPNSITPETNSSTLRKSGVFLNSNGATKMEVTSPPEDIDKMPIDSGGRKTDDARKMSFSFLDDGNLLCSPYLMDLCSDDYSMDGPLDNGFLQESEITKVLSEWTT